MMRDRIAEINHAVEQGLRVELFFDKLKCGSALHRFTLDFNKQSSIIAGLAQRTSWEALRARYILGRWQGGGGPDATAMIEIVLPPVAQICVIIAGACRLTCIIQASYGLE